MNDATALFIIWGLFCVIIFEFFYLKWAIGEEKKEKKIFLDQIQAQNRALISKNANDYVMTTSIDKVIKDEKQEVTIPNDEAPEEKMSDDEFFDMMAKSNKAAREQSNKS